MMKKTSTKQSVKKSEEGLKEQEPFSLSTQELDASRQSMIVKYVQSERSGIRLHNLTRYSVGYVVRGQKYIYYGDIRYLVNRGDLFYLGAGQHFVEDLPDQNRAFEQIVFYYTAQELAKVLNHLHLNYRVDISDDHFCSRCDTQAHVLVHSWSMVRNFFDSINHYVREDMFQDQTAEQIKMTELMYLVLSHQGSCLKRKILSNLDVIRESFEQMVTEHIFDEISIEELANKMGRSLTSFKKEFKKHFLESPHKWFVRQRLMHARLQLISSAKSVSQIGVECAFPNISHFIKLFKKEYELTPAQYRLKYQRDRAERTLNFQEQNQETRNAQLNQQQSNSNGKVNGESHPQVLEPELEQSQMEINGFDPEI